MVMDEGDLMALNAAMQMEDVPLYRRIFADVEERILSGAWPPGFRIPSEKELAARYGCARMTVNKAISQLAREGYIERRRRAGSVVVRPHAQSAVLEIHDIETEVSSLGMPYGYTLLSHREVRGRHPDTAHFDDDGESPLLALTALHTSGKQPFCFEERLINLDAVPEAMEMPFAEEAPGTWLLRRVPWNQAEHEISARGATAAAAAALRIPEGAPCLVIERRTWNAAHIVTFVRLTYAGESHSLVASFRPGESG